MAKLALCLQERLRPEGVTSSSHLPFYISVCPAMFIVPYNFRDRSTLPLCSGGRTTETNHNSPNMSNRRDSTGLDVFLDCIASASRLRGIERSHEARRGSGPNGRTQAGRDQSQAHCRGQANHSPSTTGAQPIRSTNGRSDDNQQQNRSDSTSRPVDRNVVAEQREIAQMDTQVTSTRIPSW